MTATRIKKPEGSQTRSKGAMSPPSRRPKVEIVYCDVVSTPSFCVGYGESRRQPTDWMFEFRANVSADPRRGIAAFTYFATWRISPKLPGRLAAIVELKERARQKGIALLEVFDVWGPQ